MFNIKIKSITANIIKSVTPFSAPPTTIFIGLMANQGTRKISFNFIKEYFKAMLVPVLTVCYFGLVNAFQLGLNNFDSSTSGGTGTGLLASIVLAISTLSIAGKKLDKLIN